MRRLVILLLFGLVLAGGAAITWQAMGRAKLVEEDLTTEHAVVDRSRSPGFGVTLFQQSHCYPIEMLAQSDRINTLEANNDADSRPNRVTTGRPPAQATSPQDSPGPETPQTLMAKAPTFDPSRDGRKRSATR